MFEQQLASWQSCYLAIAAASATLAGLLFVALSLHVRIMQDPKSANVRRLAEHTFRDFVRCLLACLFLLIPTAGPALLGLILITVGLFGIGRVGMTLVQTYRDRVATAHGRYVMQRLSLSTVADIFLLVAGYSIYVQRLGIDYWMLLFGALVVMLISSTRNAWCILVHELS